MVRSKSACLCGMLLTPPTSRAMSSWPQGFSVRTPFSYQPTANNNDHRRCVFIKEVGNRLIYVGFSSAGPFMPSRELTVTRPTVFVPIPLWLTGFPVVIAPSIRIIGARTVGGASPIPTHSVIGRRERWSPPASTAVIRSRAIISLVTAVIRTRKR